MRLACHSKIIEHVDLDCGHGSKPDHENLLPGFNCFGIIGSLKRS